MSVQTPAQPEGRAALTRRRLTLSGDRFEDLAILGLLVGIVVVFGILSPSGTFLAATNFRNIGLDTAEILVLAVGMTLLLVAGALDLSVGPLVIFAAVASSKTMVSIVGDGASPHHVGLAIVAGTLVAVVAGTAWGLVNGFLTVKLKIPAFITTLATAGIALGLALVWTKGLPVSGVPPTLQTSFGLGTILGIPWPVVIAAIVAAVGWVALARTRFGVRTYAIGGNAEAARRAGIRVDRHLIGLFALMGLLAGIVGIIDVSRFGGGQVAGHTDDALNAIAAAVIGGTSLFGGRGRIAGTIIGALIPGVLRNGFIILGVQPYWQQVAVGAVLLGAVYVDQSRRRRLQHI
jgi:ribose transport system permease protein